MDAIRLLLSFIFPPTHEEELVRRLTEWELNERIRPREHTGVTTLASYDDPAVRALVWQAKYRKDARALALIGGVVAGQLEKCPADVLIIPIPLSLKRMRERGYNQVEEALRSTTLSGRVRTDLLIRTRDTVPQTQLSRSARLTNLVGAFKVPDDARDVVRGADLIVVDDVLTTGATLEEARRALIQAGARSVQRLAFARS